MQCNCVITCISILDYFYLYKKMMPFDVLRVILWNLFHKITLPPIHGIKPHRFTLCTYGAYPFRFTVSNAALAANLLQTRLGIQNVQIDNANGLTVRDLRLDAGAAVRLLVDAGLSVTDAHLYEDTLEDYFKQVTGGEGIA